MAKVLFEGRKELDYRVNEAYKSLRTNVQFSGTDVQVIDFTSCTPNEGKVVSASIWQFPLRIVASVL